ncbi:transcriptional regulator [Paenibacillus sp. RC67]|uniref:helix-turn-helix domain-containing protein n=1 Tax=Paenibacillus sp. RC67 TaxID=3039392 RepID=UPI0024AD9C1B|nr:transcriptional regulator [Paenibacillus sp. RC67]
MNEIGLYIKTMRQQRGVDIMDFARELGVSPDYLSNLESGKTRTLQLEIINKLQNEFQMIEDNEVEPYIENNVGTRIEHLAVSLRALYDSDPKAAEYLIGIVEQGFEWMISSGMLQQDAYLKPNRSRIDETSF